MRTKTAAIGKLAVWLGGTAGGALLAGSALAQTTPVQTGPAQTAPAQTAPAQTSAASPEAPAADNAVAEVVVTADRQNAVSIQRSGVAITAIDPQRLDREGGQSFSDALSRVPSVELQQTSPGQNKFNIRGVSATTFNQTDVQDRSLVSVYLDETPISLQGNTPDLRVFDLERIEVVRGPQGTLYGAGAMAGNIRLITEKPNSNRFFGDVESTVGGTDGGGTDYSLRGTVNVPIIQDKLAARLALYHGYDSGYIDNVGLRKSDANDDETTQARLAVRFTPTPRLTVDFAYVNANLKTGGENTTLSGLPMQYSSTIREHYRDHYQLFNVTGAYDFGWSNLVSSTSYTDRTFGRLYSGQYLVHALALQYVGQTYDQVVAPNNIQNTLSDFTQEVRLNSKGDHVFNWIVGAFYESQRRRNDQNIISPGFDAAIAPLVGGVFPSTSAWAAPFNDEAFYGLQAVAENQYAIFGEVRLHPTAKLNLTAGARYFDFSQQFFLYNGGILGALGFATPFQKNGRAHETGVNPRFAATYQVTPATLLFAEAAKGFRYGGVNQPVPSSCGTGPDTFGPDQLWSYSIGEKSTLLDRRVTFNVNAFLIDWKDVQTRKYLPCSYYYIVNSGKVQSKGVELETRARITDRLTVGVNAAYNDAAANGAIPNVSAQDGDQTPYTSEYTASADGSYRIPIGDNVLEFQASYQYRSNQHTDFNLAAGDYFNIPSQNIVNVAVNFEAAKFEVGFFIRNLTDTSPIFDITNNYRYPGTKLYYGRPRSFGLRAKYKF